MSAPSTRVSWLIVAALATVLAGCGGGGGGTSSDSFGRISLEGITFEDPPHQNSGGDWRAPDNASLVQIIRLTFSGPVSPEEVGEKSIQVRDLVNNIVPGEYVVDGRTVWFYPRLPTRPIIALGPGVWDNGGAGLAPGTFYNVKVPVGTPDALSTLANVDEDVWRRYDYQVPIGTGFVGRDYPSGAREGDFGVRFVTTANSAQFLSGYETNVPRLVSVSPSPDSDGVSPFLYTDPEVRFPENTPLELTFDFPLDPSATNINDQVFTLIDVENEAGDLINVELGIDVKLKVNRYNESRIRIHPSGILPFGDLLGLVYRQTLRGISGGSEERDVEEVAGLFRVARVEAAETVADRFVEEFTDQEYRESEASEFDPGTIPADWNVEDSGFLQAADAFSGTGALGVFNPLDDGTPRTIVLDTNSQSFPLFDGSTPDAPPGTIVTNGVFEFTEIFIPRNITIQAQGSNPLVLNATGSIVIEGTIDLSGARGADDQTYDSAITPTPGGPGGPGAGRGGAGNPTLWSGAPSLLTQVPPRFGEAGWGGTVQSGGFGGEGGIQAFPVLDCTPNQGAANNNGSRAGGGGGGTFLGLGQRGFDGIGTDIKVSRQMLDPANLQRPLFSDAPGPPLGGPPGLSPFTDNDSENDYIGPLAEVTTLIGGQGGGGGGNRHDSYHCHQTVPLPFPGVTVDSKGGGGGGGGGSCRLAAMGPITVRSTAVLISRGGDGGGGEQVGCSNWGGGGGAGSGGAIIVRSGTNVIVEDSSRIDVRGGTGERAAATLDPLINCGSPEPPQPGSGGNGGHGLIQIETPRDVPPIIGDDAEMVPAAAVIPFEKTPSAITPFSVGQSQWIDLGQVIRRPKGAPRFQFRGTDSETGLVLTEPGGTIPNPELNSFHIELPPVIDPITQEILEPGVRDFIPEQATIRIEFQSADAITPGSKEIDPASVSPAPGLWSPNIDVANGRQFLRYRVVFNIADAQQGYQLLPGTRRPVVTDIDLESEF